jgi:very-short-patch-repair endonuclease
MYDPEAVISLPSVPSGYYESINELDEKADDLLVLELAITLDRIGNMEIYNQDREMKTVHLSLKRCRELLLSNRMKFTGKIITMIIHALPKLPISIKTYKELYEGLLERSLYISKKGAFSTGNSATLLCALAKLSEDFTNYDNLITSLLQPFVSSNRTVLQLSPPSLSELWQFCAFSLTKSYKSEELTALITIINKKLNPSDFSVTTSSLQNQVTKILNSILADDCEEIEVEYQVFVYSLDIAFLNNKINVEIDGPHHYREEILSRNSRFRDYILTNYANWTVIRVPYFHWEKLVDHQDKIDYLVKKLANYAHIFKPSYFMKITEQKRLESSTKNDLLYSNQAANIPFAETSEEILDDDGEKKAPANNKIHTANLRYLNRVFVDKFINSEWELYTSGSGDYFRLRKRKIKKKERATFEKIAIAANLNIKFKKSKTEPGYFRILIDKNSQGLKDHRRRSRFNKVMTRLFPKSDETNNVETIASIIYDYWL